MIRPVTCLAMLMAAGSGLYLYQAKHQAYVLDHQIAQVIEETGRVRARIGVMRAEYALLNDPSRLQDLAASHLPALAPMAPGQFTMLAELDQRLPPVGQPPAPPAPLDVSAPAAGIGVKTGAVPYDFPPAPQPKPAAASPLVAGAATAPLHIATAVAARRGRPALYASAARPAHRAVAYAPNTARPDPMAIQAAAPPMPAAPQQAGSVLGMARTLAPAAVSYQRYQPGAQEMLSR